MPPYSDLLGFISSLQEIVNGSFLYNHTAANVEKAFKDVLKWI